MMQDYNKHITRPSVLTWASTSVPGFFPALEEGLARDVDAAFVTTLLGTEAATSWLSGLGRVEERLSGFL